MQAGYAQSASRPPAFPEAPDAMDVASRMVMLWSEELKAGWRVRK